MHKHLEIDTLTAGCPDSMLVGGQSDNPHLITRTQYGYIVWLQIPRGGKTASTSRGVVRNDGNSDEKSLCAGLLGRPADRGDNLLKLSRRCLSHH